MVNHDQDTTPDGATSLAKTTMRRVVVRLIPFLLLCYFFSFLNRVSVAFAALQMNHDLGLTPAVYGLAAGLFFLTYCFFGVPSNLALYRFGATRWIAGILFAWGLCATALAFVVGPYSYYVMRLLLGAAEAGYFPGILFFLTLWFPAAWRGRMVALFMTGVAASGLIGSPLSGALLGLDGDWGLRGWQWMFIIEGLPPVILAPLCLLVLQDGPAQAKWLPAPEKTWLITTLQAEHGGKATERKASGWTALVHPRVWLLAAMWFSNAAVLNGILFFLPMILKGFGMSNTQTGFVAAIPSAAALVAVIWWGRHSDQKNERYGHAGFANFVAGIALLISVLVADPTLRIVLITISFAATLAFTAPFWTIPPTFLTGAASAGGIAAISSIGVIGGFVAPTIIGYLTGLTGDSRVGLAFVAVLAMVVSGVFYFVGRHMVAKDRMQAPVPEPSR